MAIMNNSTFPSNISARLALIKATAMDIEERHQPEYQERYRVSTIGGGAFQNYVLLESVGHPTQVNPGTNLPLVSFREAYTKKVTFDKHGFRIQFVEESTEDDLDGIFQRGSAMLMDKMLENDEILAVDLFEQGDTGTDAVYLTADGENIFDASHPISQGATTDSNLLSAASLGFTSLEAMHVALTTMVDQSGDLIRDMPRWLDVPQTQFYQAQRLLGQLQTDPETAERAAHPFGRTPVQARLYAHLTNQTAYYMSTDRCTSSEFGWNWIWKRATRMQDTINEVNETATMTASKRLGRVVPDWRGRVKVPSS